MSASLCCTNFLFSYFNYLYLSTLSKMLIEKHYKWLRELHESKSE